MKGGVWTNNVELVPLPESVLDLSRIGPVSRPVNGPDGNPAGSRNSVSENMETTDSEALQG
jgi:hypothetical protein